MEATNRLEASTSMRVLRFLTTGGAGFAVDAGVLGMLLEFTRLGPVWSRCISFPAALLVTWTINRSWAFCGRLVPSLRTEVVGYLIVQVIGFALNWGVYLALVEGTFHRSCHIMRLPSARSCQQL